MAKLTTEHDYSKKDIIKLAHKYGIDWVRLEFVDINGDMKKIEIPSYQLKKILNGQIMFDGSSIKGYTPIEASDLYLQPDLSTFMIDPLNFKVARLICDVKKTDGTPFMNDPRTILKQELKRAKKMGFDTFNVGLEPEFFLFKADENGQPEFMNKDGLSYFDIGSQDGNAKCRRIIANVLEGVGLHIEAAHHEVAPNQNEIDFRFSDALNTADNIELFKDIAKNVAKENGYVATFMPKPLNSVNGSGMHINQSLMKNGKNVFYDPSTKTKLSKTAEAYAAGLLKHAKGFTAITNATVNSYKRLIPGFEAPVYIAWALHNRTALIRVPSDRGIGTRLELRNADLSSNPYLALASVLAAGLDGIKNNLTPPQPIEKNIFKMNSKQLNKLGIVHLPSNLSSALDTLGHDKVITNALGKSITKAYTQSKKQDVLSYNSNVTAWERKHYFNV